MNTIKKILATNPVVAQAVIRAFFVLLGSILAAVNLTLPENLEGNVLAIVAAFYVLVEVITSAIARSKVTPDINVVERVEVPKDSDVANVVAGPANDMVATGEVIRTVRDLPSV